MKILVAIANHGTKNRKYLDRLLQAYRAMPFDVHVVVLSDQPKDLGDDVEVRVGAPTSDPWSLPFAHQKIFAGRINEFDLFIYSEDDVLITERNVKAFVEVTENLREDEIAGFLRSEEGPDGTLYCPEAHGQFHWVPNSLRRRGANALAVFTSEHSACYVLTRKQLQKAIDSGGYLVPPHSERYDLLVTAATDPYVQCGMTKLICLDRFDDFILPHLPNRYVGQLGMEWREMHLQVDRMLELEHAAKAVGTLAPSENELPTALWVKNYYEPVRKDMLSLLPESAQDVLSIGCDSGETERHLIERGCRVTAIPVDPVIAAVAQSKGVNTIDCGLDGAKRELANHRFDAVLCAGVLHLSSDPVELLKFANSMLKPGGKIIVSVPNLNFYRTLIPRLRGVAGYRDVGKFDVSKVQTVTRRRLEKWFKRAGLRRDRLIAEVMPNRRKLGRFLGRIATELFALDVIASASPIRSVSEVNSKPVSEEVSCQLPA
jgi:2-polyprenyl-3-methyl-5-hydroxy-6-metoxy-1,4-benzoquinol methylase